MADQQWDELVAGWQQCEPSEADSATTAEDLKALETKTRKKARRMMFFMWGDIISTIFFTLFFIYLGLFADLNLHQSVIFLGVLFIIVPMGIYSVVVRQGLWKATGHSTQAYLELAKNRAIAGIKLAKANMLSALVAFPFIIAVVLWKAFSEVEPISWPWNHYMGVIVLELIIFAGLYFGARYYRNKMQNEHAQLDDMLKQFQQSD